jgi:hypothetical protein
LHLREKAKDRVYVRDDTYAIWVALALITATLPINERAGVLRAKNFDIAEITAIFCYPDHDLAIVARVPNPGSSTKHGLDLEEGF